MLEDVEEGNETLKFEAEDLNLYTDFGGMELPEVCTSKEDPPTCGSKKAGFAFRHWRSSGGDTRHLLSGENLTSGHDHTENICLVYDSVNHLQWSGHQRSMFWASPDITTPGHI